MRTLTHRDIARLALVPPQDAVLNHVASEVKADEINTGVFQALVDRMLTIARGETVETSGMRLVGLAAPQIGVSKRLIIVDTIFTGEDIHAEQSVLQAFVNARIVERSDETELRREGCYSTGNVRGLVQRAARITVEAHDRNGDLMSAVVDGFTARVFQHEIDHLNGIRFPDRITNEAHLHWVEKKDLAAYRLRADNWTALCPRERWEGFKVAPRRIDDLSLTAWED